MVSWIKGKIHGFDQRTGYTEIERGCVIENIDVLTRARVACYGYLAVYLQRSAIFWEVYNLSDRVAVLVDEVVEVDGWT